MQRVIVAPAFTQALQPHWQLLENTSRPQICANHTYVQNMKEPLSELQLTSQSQFLGKLGEGGELSYSKPQQQYCLNLQGVRAICWLTWINHCIATLFWSRWVVWVWLAPISLSLMCLSRGFLVLERPLTFHRQVLPDIIWELFIKYLPPILKGLGLKLLVAKHLLKNAAGEVSDELCKGLSRSSRRLCSGTHQRLPRGFPPIIIYIW